ncbi:MAG: hypothetical protein SPL05_02390 [Eubacteriales bacterium]|nr:hypothetical protein [Eubacteriales bacterium]
MSSVFAADVKITLITMDSIDQHWVTLNEGAVVDTGVSVLKK